MDGSQLFPNLVVYRGENQSGEEGWQPNPRFGLATTKVPKKLGKNLFVKKSMVLFLYHRNYAIEKNRSPDLGNWNMYKPVPHPLLTMLSNLRRT